MLKFTRLVLRFEIDLVRRFDCENRIFFLLFSIQFRWSFSILNTSVDIFFFLLYYCILILIWIQTTIFSIIVYDPSFVFLRILCDDDHHYHHHHRLLSLKIFIIIRERNIKKKKESCYSKQTLRIRMFFPWKKMERKRKILFSQSSSFDRIERFSFFFLQFKVHFSFDFFLHSFI